MPSTRSVAMLRDVTDPGYCGIPGGQRRTASQPEFKDASRSLAVDWTDLESFSRPPPRGTSDYADPEASWGPRKNNLLRNENELFFGHYLSAVVMMPDENGPAPVLTAMPAAGIPLGDILDC